jgi:hypothetical protein
MVKPWADEAAAMLKVVDASPFSHCLGYGQFGKDTEAGKAISVPGKEFDIKLITNHKKIGLNIDTPLGVSSP